MKSDFVQIDITKDEVIKLFQGLGLRITEYEGGGTVCLNEHCHSYNEENGSDTHEILTKDDYILNGLQCEYCHEFSFYTIEACEFDSKFNEEGLNTVNTAQKGQQLNFYEVYDPYYALILAKDEEAAYQIYIDTVADDDGNLHEEIEEVDREYGIVKYSRAKSEDGELLEISEILEGLKTDESKLLLIDGSLL